MHKVRYALFYDNHTHPENPDVGKNFDPEDFTELSARMEEYLDEFDRNGLAAVSVDL